MRSEAISAILLPLLLSLPAAAAAAKPPKNAILLSHVKTLTLRGDGAQTTHRRLPAVPQLKCLSAPKLCALHPIDVLRCTNQGSGYDTEDIQWSCAASLPVDLKLGSTDVLCEGYSSADDPYVLKGSCGVEYRVVLTDEGERRHPDLAGGNGGWGGGAGGRRRCRGFCSWCSSLAVFAWIVYSRGLALAAEATAPTTVTVGALAPRGLLQGPAHRRDMRALASGPQIGDKAACFPRREDWSTGITILDSFRIWQHWLVLLDSTSSRNNVPTTMRVLLTATLPQCIRSLAGPMRRPPREHIRGYI
ncbi:transmembrane protein [Verticillium alfalfae VaMs.102]|uniref:Store-operated calcium entry-associated regulatory factor n=1 Tax=Verticillium alfalfae (strain VaMs.102 / ATCC MYA-4576 / FGSC 10136) TaxID=526221 RepID=C9SDX9_VERA1|nr:transmembrane protein [Verticillium alfalfae VaMs.102]EEY16465.1 transmembrane protein [Verticillium alfalfae VaMs.102]